MLLNTFTEFGIERVVGAHLAFVKSVDERQKQGIEEQQQTRQVIASEGQQTRAAIENLDASISRIVPPATKPPADGTSGAGPL